MALFWLSQSVGREGLGSLGGEEEGDEKQAEEDS